MGIQSSHLSTADERRLQKIFDAEFERRLVVQNITSAQERAFEITKTKQRVSWELMAGITTTTVLLAAGSIYKRREFSLPIVPIILAMGYRFDTTFGDAEKSIRDQADEIYKNESTRLQLPGGPITIRELDQYTAQKAL
ncbi:unnamed protein product, partial [Mesorhabditis belari]|uniref:Uncharacterized protein n=1 Tax=Mesorhabditis belari TaxID=2138241 RepID=A0AAF3EZN7_9BILA